MEDIEFTDKPVPLAPGETKPLDEMPTTGETTDPFLNLTIGLLLAFIGGITIIGVKKRKKDEEEDENNS